MKKIAFVSLLYVSVSILCYAQDVTRVPEETSVQNTGTAHKTISLDIKGMDITDVLKIFSQEAGFNIVVGKNVVGRVTIFLKNVDVWDAFTIILLSNDLAFEQSGGIITVMNGRDYELANGKKFTDKRAVAVVKLRHAKAAHAAQAANQVKSTIGTIVVDEGSNAVVIVDSPEKIKIITGLLAKLDAPLTTKVFTLNYAKAEDIKTKIQDDISKWVGSMRIDTRTNKISVTDYPEKIDSLEHLITAFDERNRQVVIDAQIVEISPERDEFKMGVDWDYWIEKNIRVSSLLSMGTSNTLSAGTAAARLAVTEQGESKSILDALRTIGKTKILSSPRIMALTNQEAKILVGSKEAYLTETVTQPGTGSAVTATQVNFVDVGVQLYVTPIINAEDFVTMKIRPVISSAEYIQLTSADKKSQIPIVSTSEAETSVMVKNGVTIMIAGLKKDKKEEEVKKIPILGDIPFLGFLFRSSKQVTVKTELVIFLTPRVVSGDAPLEYQSLTNDTAINSIVSPAN